MLDALSAPGLQPFTFALFALLGLLVLELALMLIGLSSDLGLGSVELPEADLGLPELPDLSDAALAEIYPFAEPAPGSPSEGMAPMLRSLGLGDAPAMVWLASLAGAFAALGFTLQAVANASLGRPLSPVVASILIAIPALLIARAVAKAIGRILPSVESYGTSSFHRRLGVVTVGMARSGFPAEVRYLDSFGTSHQLMAEPLDADDTIPAGAQVIILRDRAGKPRLVPLS